MNQKYFLGINVSAKYKTATDFRRSLETRLQALAAKTGEDLQRLRRKVAFDRFLARVFYQGQSEFYLKGGYAMELRIAHARATKDIDLTCVTRIKNENDLLSELIWSDLQSIAKINLNDHFVYQVGMAQLDLENAPYGGARYPIASLLDGKIFVRFHVDVGADFLLDKVESIQGSNWLEFNEIPAPIIPMISIEQQFAEKLHAYTLPRPGTINSRVKDLVDMILLLNIRVPNLHELKHTIDKVFEKRATHNPPEKLEYPPAQWENPFNSMATECGFSLNMQASFDRISQFYNAVITTSELVAP